MKAQSDLSQFQRFIEAMWRTNLMDVFGRSTPISELSEADAMRESWELVGEDLRAGMAKASDELSDADRERLSHELVEAR